MQKTQQGGVKVSFEYMNQEDTRRIKAAIVGAGYTMESLSKALKKSRATLSSRINGKTDFSKSEMEEIGFGSRLFLTCI